MNADADAQRLFQIGLDLRIEQSVACLVWVTSVELGPSVTFPLSPPEADVGADIVLRRLVPLPDSCSAANDVRRLTIRLPHRPSFG
jgi:hypothetical protein